jgi:hypothetical protein
MARSSTKVLQRRARQRRYLARRCVGLSVIPVTTDPTDVVDFLHLAEVNAPDAHPTTLAVCVETLIELALGPVVYA